MSQNEAPAKVSVAMGLQLQVQVSDTATVMLQTHVDRDDAAERNKSIDIAHAAAERLFHRYRITTLGGLIRQTEIAIQGEHDRAAKDAEHFKAETERRAAAKDAAMAIDRAKFVDDGKRGDFKPSGAAVQSVQRLEAEHEKAAAQQAQQFEQTQVNIRKHWRDLNAMRAEREQLETLLNGANE